MASATRLARSQDAAAVADIYNQGIEDGLATFETEPRNAADVQRWSRGFRSWSQRVRAAR